MMLTPLLLSIYTISPTTAAIAPLIDALSDSQFSTNSMHAHNVCEPWDAKYTVSDNRDGWCAADTNFGFPNGPYLEINFGRKTNIHAIATKGRGCCDQYVTSYILSYYDGTTWMQYDSGFVFVGNNNNNGNYQQEVRHELIDYNGILVAVQYIRFYPITYSSHAAMRVEAYGNDWTASPTESPSKPPSLNPTLQPIHPTFQPTVSPNNIPTIDPTYDPSFPPTQVTLPPTNDPTLTPTNDPTSNPTKHPTSNPTDVPTLGPSNNPSSSPTNPPTFPSLNPTKNPTSDPTVAPTFAPTNFTFNPTLTPSENPTVSTSNPTVSTNNPTRHDNGGEVDDETTAYNGSDDENKLSNTSNNGLPIWIYILIVCSGILCCLAFILIGYSMKRSNKRKESHGNAFRMQANTELDGDIWTNPVHKTFAHHQLASNSNVHNINSEGNVLTTKISDESNQQEYDTTPTTVEMNNMTTRRAGEGPDELEIMDDEVLTPNGYENGDTDDIDNINNAANGMDNEVIDINDIIMTPNGDEIDNIINNDDAEMIDDIDIIATKGGTNMGDDEDIDAIDNNINDVNNDEIVNDIDDMITYGGDNDDIDAINNNVNDENSGEILNDIDNMITDGGDNDDIIIDNIDREEYDDEDIIVGDLQTIQ